MTGRANQYRRDPEERTCRVVWFKTIGVLVLAGFAVVGLSAAFARGYHALLESSILQLRSVEITGLERLDRRTVLDTLGVPKGANVLSLRLDRLARRLERLPWVKDAVLRLDAPGRLVVAVRERKPFAVVHGDTTYLADEEGRLFLETTVQSHLELPLITARSLQALKDGTDLRPEIFQAFRDLLELLERTDWLPPSAVSEFRWEDPFGFVLLTNPKGVTVRVGRGGFKEKLDRLHRLLMVLQERNLLEAVTAVDLDYVDRAFVKGRFGESTGV